MKRESQTGTKFSFPKEFLDTLRNTIKIEELIADYVTLKKQGQGFTGLCPFHVEKTPSFSVSPARKLYHCFGCLKGGDAIGFIMDKEGLSFVEAVKLLADKYFIAIPESVKNTEYEKKISILDNLVLLNNTVKEHWKTQLEINEAGKQYLSDRGITQETRELFEIGYSVDNWDTVKNLLLDAGVKEADIKLSGLVTENEKKDAYYDRFRDRIMTPIMDIRGRTIAFGGRSMSNTGIKYLNSPETPLYIKGNHLYGLYQTRESIRQKGFAILTEGYFDLLSLYQNGITNVVANLGTALTDAQANLLKRFTDKVVICYDGDSAGQAASERTVKILSKNGFTVKVMTLPDAKDPDDYIREFGKDTFNKRRGQSVDWFRFLVGRITKKYDISNPSEKVRAVDAILKLVEDCNTPLERREYFDLAMKLLKVDSTLTSKLWSKIGKDTKTSETEIIVPPSLAEIKFLDLIVCDPLRTHHINILKLSLHTTLTINPLLTVINRNGELVYSELEELLDENSNKLLREALLKSEETISQYGDDLREELGNCIEALTKLEIESQLEELEKQIKEETDEEKLMELMDIQVSLYTALEHY